MTLRDFAKIRSVDLKVGGTSTKPKVLEPVTVCAHTHVGARLCDGGYVPEHVPTCIDSEAKTVRTNLTFGFETTCFCLENESQGGRLSTR